MTDCAAFPARRAAALEALQGFLPRAGRQYAAQRNFDRGPGRQTGVSQISPYLRHRVLTEEEVLRAVLGRHSEQAAAKFVQEVFWRTYWKGWLEMRPEVWRAYQAGLLRRLDEVQSAAGVRARWEAACSGETGLACFDAWARELATTGYLHNHARMWFASIWIFTLRLPWELGADFFLRHLLDGDPASNTLSWRWVAGLQTQGKHYLARPGNIAKYTEGRFCPAPGELDTGAAPLAGPPHPERRPPPEGDTLDTAVRSLFVLHEDDLSPGWVLESGLTPVGTALLRPRDGLTPLHPSPGVTAFRDALVQETADRWRARLGDAVESVASADALTRMATRLGAVQIVTCHAPVGPVADVLDRVSGVPVVRLLRPYDARAWPHATAGFFKFKAQIPLLLRAIEGLRLA
ncbi:FAD-binding domain-containing protein [Antarctobacter sp.]|uniref:FAD-binding domain-containing protein n=1 Tax=Antarctobacter sp. TaxID=1872577 RepID=UPI002B26D71E|nr:FAD-binding domain-containing protein [Antarctobacter sp.]